MCTGSLFITLVININGHVENTACPFYMTFTIYYNLLMRSV